MPFTVALISSHFIAIIYYADFHEGRRKRKGFFSRLGLYNLPQGGGE